MNAPIPPDSLQAIERRLHALIREIATDYRITGLPMLPSLEDAARSPGVRREFVIPGMYGGFSYWFDSEAAEPALMAESWSRVVGGSGQRHAITVSGTKLVDAGFG